MSRRRGSVAALAFLLTVAGVAVAQDAPRIEPEADEILKIMGEVLAEASSFTVRNETTSDEHSYTGQLVELSSSIDVAVRRPDRAHAVVTGDQSATRYWIGGGKLAVVDVSRWTYAEATVAADLDRAIDDAWSRYGLKIPLADFISNDPYADLTRNVEAGFYAGLHKIDGVPCHHLVFRQSDIDWQIWIDDGMRPLPRKLMITYKNESGAPRYTARFSEWDLSPGLGDRVFEFSPPEGAEQVEFATTAEIGDEEE